MKAEFLSAITTGFLGGFAHCTFMCSPVISSVVLEKNQSSYLLFLKQMLYHSGRIFTYSLVGFIMGYTGSFVNVMGSVIGINNIILLIVSMFMIYKGLEILEWKPLRKAYLFVARLESAGLNLARYTKSIHDVPTIWKYFLIGMLLGLLPCGLSYTAFIAASGTGDALKGFLYMFLFGLGNVPSLVLFVSFYQKVFQFRKIFNYLTALAFFGFGAYNFYLFVKNLKL